MFTYTKKRTKCICLRMQNLKRYAQLNVYIKKLPAGCRQQKCICLYAYTFSPHANSSCQTSGQKVKKCIHYIYTKYLFFIFKKCIHYIYTRKHISSRQQSFQRPHHYSPIHKTSRQQAETDQTATLPFLHFAGIYNAAKPNNHNAATTTQQKKYTLIQPQVYTHFFAHFSRFPQNGRQKIYLLQEKNRRKKDKKGIKRY